MRVAGTKANRRFSYDGNKGLKAEAQKAREELEKKTTQQRSAIIYAGHTKKQKKSMKHTSKE
ncbi:MAG: hypothetical protein NC311_13105 [Muribaculaceae bacterium]|nr:hypothetical protein [Muribaculaceae bacterium]MCM1417073.1 hypothetical protein [bacterium]MCM1468600.1 hypothetical protein [Alistipes sp.]